MTSVVLSAIVGLGGLAFGILAHSATLKQEKELKQFEITFIAKQSAYASFINCLYRSLSAALDKDPGLLFANEKELEALFFSLEPFLEQEDRRVEWDRLQQFFLFCTSINNRQSLSDEDLEEIFGTFVEFRNEFRQSLFQSLFGQEPTLLR